MKNNLVPVLYEDIIEENKKLKVLVEKLQEETNRLQRLIEVQDQIATLSKEIDEAISKEVYVGPY